MAARSRRTSSVRSPVVPAHGTSHEDQCGPTGMPAFAERGEGTPRRDREVSKERSASRSHGVAVRLGIGDDQEHARRAGITRLQRDPSRLRLQVRDPGLDLDIELIRELPKAIEPTDRTVPRTQVTRDRQRSFGDEPDPRRQQVSKSGQDAHVTHVTEWIATRVQPEPSIQTHDGREDGDLLHRHADEAPALDPRDVRRRDAACMRYRSQRQAGGGSGASKLDPGPDPVGLGSSPGADDCAHARRHASSVMNGR
jgi:hypothetical protein